jgi:nucleotide-binding universal stress UspA family protein
LYGHILVPISRTSNLKFLVEFVNDFLRPGGELTLLHVITSNIFSVSPAEWRRAMSAISTTHLLYAKDNMGVNYRVRNAGTVTSGILGEASTGKYDLILLSNSTYHKRLKNIFGGKVDEIIRKSSIESAVLSYHDDRPLSYRRILIPTSGYQHATRAAKLAEVLSKKYQSEVTALYVGESKEEAARALKPVTDSFEGSNITHRALFRKGPVVETIIDEADKGYDLMMIGATERAAYQQFLLGSTADKLIKMSPCPVLMVKSIGNT